MRDVVFLISKQSQTPALPAKLIQDASPMFHCEVQWEIFSSGKECFMTVFVFRTVWTGTSNVCAAPGDGAEDAPGFWGSKPCWHPREWLRACGVLSLTHS